MSREQPKVIPVAYAMIGVCRCLRSSPAGARCAASGPPSTGARAFHIKPLRPWYNTGMSTHDVDGLNAGYARALLDDYLENPDAVPSEWRALFESGDSELVATHPGIARLLEQLPQATGNGANGHTEAPTAPPPPLEPTSDDSSQSPDAQLLGGVAPAMALGRAPRTPGPLAAGLDPLGSEPVGDPSLEPMRLEPKLTPELQARIPASYLRVHVPGETLLEVLPRLGETYSSTIAYELEHLSDHQHRVWPRQAIETR